LAAASRPRARPRSARRTGRHSRQGSAPPRVAAPPLGDIGLPGPAALPGLKRGGRLAGGRRSRV